MCINILDYIMKIKKDTKGDRRRVESSNRKTDMWDGFKKEEIY